jgi:hypothetical protein
VICAVSPWFAGVLVGRAVVGFGAGLVFVIVPVVARATGGARLVGLFGRSGSRWRWQSAARWPTPA